MAIIKSMSTLVYKDGKKVFSEPIKIGVDADSVAVGEKVKDILTENNVELDSNDLDSAVAEIGNAIFEHRDAEVTDENGAHGLRYNATDSVLEYYDGNDWQVASSKVDEATFENAGVVKLSNDGDVALEDTAGLALPASEKNAEVEGSLANQINNKLDIDGDSKDNVVTFESNDNIEDVEWTDVNVLGTGESHSGILNKVSTMFKNIRYLAKMLGNTDISAIGNGTATGAISSLNESLEKLESSALGSRGAIDLKSYTSTLYTFPADGYLELASGGTSYGSYISVNLYGSNNNDIKVRLSTRGVSNGYAYNALFVKKGMKMKVLSNSSNETILFIPFITEE